MRMKEEAPDFPTAERTRLLIAPDVPRAAGTRQKTRQPHAPIVPETRCRRYVLVNDHLPSDANLYNFHTRHPAHNPVGVRVKLRVPAAKCTVNDGCLGFDLGGGYLPSPADALISVNLTFR